MENASKALIMAAAILIGIIVLSLGVYLFVTFGKSAAETEEQNRQTQIAQFNSQFTKYDKQTDTTIYDILTVANLAQENNRNYGLNASNANNQSSYYIYVYANTNSGSTADFTDFENNSTKMNAELLGNSELQTYTCSVSISPITGRVYKVNFEKNK